MLSVGITHNVIKVPRKTFDATAKILERLFVKPICLPLIDVGMTVPVLHCFEFVRSYRNKQIQQFVCVKR